MSKVVTFVNNFCLEKQGRLVRGYALSKLLRLLLCCFNDVVVIKVRVSAEKGPVGHNFVGDTCFLRVIFMTVRR